MESTYQGLSASAAPLMRGEAAKLPKLPKNLLRLHAADITRLQRLFDPLAVTGVYWLLEGIHQPVVSGLLLPTWCWIALLTAIVLPRFGLYGSFRQTSLRSLASSVSWGWFMVVLSLLLLAFVSKSSANLSRLHLGYWAFTSWGVLLLNHVGTRKYMRWLRMSGLNTRSVVYWGPQESAESFFSQLREAPWMGMRCVAWFSPKAQTPNRSYPGIPRCSGGLEEMRRWLQLNTVDQIVFSHVSQNDLSMDDLIHFFGDTSVPVIYAPPWVKSSMRMKMQMIGSQVGLEVWGGDPSLIDSQLKRLFDLVLSSVGLLLISPLLLGIAIAVGSSSPGPILFRQYRYGLDGRRFQIYKFRTMRVCESGELLGLKQASRNDPRITPVGRFLRRWSLDELPQLFNVLRGEMSLVGPRPHAVAHNEQYRTQIAGYMQRHASKPGITGLAQVEGWRGETVTIEAMAQRVDADLRYQRDWSLLLDLRILLTSLLRLRSTNAY